MDVGDERPALTPLRLGIPAYFYPWPGDPAWTRLAAAPAGTILVIDPADGPGQGPDRNYAAALDAIDGACVDLLGYVDSRYANRPIDVIVDEALRYREWYGVAAVFLDQVLTTDRALDHYRAIAARLAGEGFRLSLNPGQPLIGDAFFTLAERVVVFEGTLDQHRSATLPAPPAGVARDNIWHLVYEVATAGDYAEVADRAIAAGAGVLFATDGTMPNPWDRLPPYWPAQAGAGASVPD